MVEFKSTRKCYLQTHIQISIPRHFLFRDRCLKIEVRKRLQTLSCCCISHVRIFICRLTAEILHSTHTYLLISYLFSLSLIWSHITDFSLQTTLTLLGAWMASEEPDILTLHIETGNFIYFSSWIHLFLHILTTPSTRQPPPCIYIHDFSYVDKSINHPLVFTYT